MLVGSTACVRSRPGMPKLEAINDIADRYGALGKRVTLRHLSSDCAQLLDRLHEGGLPPYETIDSDPATDPVYEVAEDSKYYRDVPIPKTGASAA